MGNAAAACFTRDPPLPEEKARGPATKAAGDKATASKTRPHLEPENNTLNRSLTELPQDDWMNDLLLELWPSIGQYIANLLKTSVEPAIKNAVPSVLRNVHFESIEFGTKPVQFKSHRIIKNSTSFSKNALQMCSVASFSEVLNLELQMELVYEGNANVLLAVSGAKLGVSNISLRGPMVIRMWHLIPRPPFFYGLSIYFPNPPVLEMTWEGIAGMLDAFSAIPSQVEKVALRQLCNRLVLPNRIAVVTAAAVENADIFWLKRPSYHGILSITVLQAESLAVGDPSWVPGLQGTSDPYVIVNLGAQEIRTKVKYRTLNPVWQNEVHNFLVDDEKIQVASFAVYDYDHVGEDDFLGDASIPVSELLDRVGKGPMWVDLEDHGGDEGHCRELGSRLQIEPIWRPLFRDRDMAKQIPRGSDTITCVLYVGLYGAEGMPQIGPAGYYWCQVGTGDADMKESTHYSLDAVTGDSREFHEDQRKKVLRLHQEGVAPEVIAEVLEVSLKGVQDFIATLNSGGERTVDVRAFGTVAWEQPFTFYLTDPHDARLNFQIMTDGDLTYGRAAPSGRRTSLGGRGKPEAVGDPYHFDVRELLEEERLNHKGYLDGLNVPGAPNARLKVKIGLFVLDDSVVAAMEEGMRPRTSTYIECDD